MRAAVVEGAGRLVVRDLPEPAMGDYGARCALLYGSVCAGTDMHLLNGEPPFCKWVKVPFIIGHESVGRVTAVGARVRNLKPGDLITRVGCPGVGEVSAGWGGFAEIGIATDWRAMQEDGLDGWRDKTVQQVLPPDIDPAAGTLFITWRETLSYVRRMGIGAAASVVVAGSGGNGLAFAAHAHNLGARRVVLVGAAQRVREARLAGADAVVDYRSGTCWDEVRALAPDGYDYAIDAIGRTAVVAGLQSVLKPGGTLGIYGMDEFGAITMTPGKTFTFYGGGYDEAEAHDDVLRFYRAGRLNPAVWSDRRSAFTLENINQAFAAVRQRQLVKPLVALQA